MGSIIHNQQIGNLEFLLKEMRAVSREHTQYKKAVSIDECVSRALEVVDSKFSGQTKVKFKESFPKERLYFYGHEESFTHVLVELYSNSVESVRNTFRPWVKLKAWEDKEMIKLLITDSGEEIAAGAKKKLFNLFFTTKVDTKSVGVGLNVAKELLREHGATIEYSYSEEVNSFLISIPKITSHH